MQLDPPAPPVPVPGGLEYTYNVNLDYDGAGSRRIETLGVFFAPMSGDIDSVSLPSVIEGTVTGVMDFTFLEAGSPEKKLVSGGFTLLWRWQNNQGPEFKDQDGQRQGEFSFNFTIADAGWSPTIYFIYGTVKEQDISYITNSPGYIEWLIEATAGDTTVRTSIIEENGFVDVLTWEIDPPA